MGLIKKLKEKKLDLEARLLFYILKWSGKKLFGGSDIYSHKGKIIGITFTSYKEYIDAIGKIEIEIEETNEI